MNPMFWLAIILALIGVWFALTPVFNSIGSAFTNMINRTRKTMSDESEEN